MDDTFTAVQLLVDTSASMALIQSDAEAGINEFLSTRGEGKRRLSVSTFATELVHVHTLVEPFAFGEKFQLRPYGMTALYDAMASTIDRFGETLRAIPEVERPAHVIFAVMTDGQENMSRMYTRAHVFDKVKVQEEVYGWTFLYLGANQDAIGVGEGLGIARERSMTYTASSVGTRSGIRSVIETVAVAAAGGQAIFTDEQRADALD